MYSCCRSSCKTAYRTTHNWIYKEFSLNWVVYFLVPRLPKIGSVCVKMAKNLLLYLPEVNANILNLKLTVNHCVTNYKICQTNTNTLEIKYKEGYTKFILMKWKYIVLMYINVLIEKIYWLFFVSINEINFLHITFI